MNRAFFQFLVLSLLCCCLNSCYSSYCRYIWDRGNVAEATWVLQPDAAELYQVGEDVYVKGARGKVRGCQKDFPPFRTIWGNIPCSETYAPEEGENETVYLKVEFLNKNSGKYRFADERQTILTELPPEARLIDARGHRPGSKVFRPNIQLCTQPQADAHALYAYPLGVATALVVDAPCTIVLNIGATAAAILYLPYYIYESLQ